MGGKGKDRQGTCIRDTWTKPKGGRIEGGRWGWVGQQGVVGGKWRQLYLNNNKKSMLSISIGETVHRRHEYETHITDCLRNTGLCRQLFEDRDHVYLLRHLFTSPALAHSVCSIHSCWVGPPCLPKQGARFQENLFPRSPDWFPLQKPALRGTVLLFRGLFFNHT